MRKTRALPLGLFIALLIVLALSHPLHARTERKTVVLETTDVLKKPDSRNETGDVEVVLRITEGQQRGDTFVHTEHQWGEPDYDRVFYPGAEFLGQVVYRDGERANVILEEQRREGKLLLLFLFVSLVLLIVGKTEGAVGFTSAFLTAFLLFYLIFPAAVRPTLILPLSLIVCLLTVAFTIFPVTGFSRSAWPASISLSIVVVFLFAFTTWGHSFLNLTASRARNSRLILAWINRMPGFTASDLWKLVTTGIVLSALGAMMDAAIVVSSTIDEISRGNPRINFKRAFASGRRVGSRILATMVNTLGFAYLGVLLPVLLAGEVFGLSWLRFINYDFVGIEVLRLSAGLLALSLVIPITAAVTAWWCVNSE